MPDGTVVPDEIPSGASTTLKQRLTIYAYIGLLYFALPFTGVWGTTARFLLKDHFHLPAESIASFLFYVNIPGYVGFVFGFFRDKWSVFGRRDQGILILFPAILAALLFAMAGLPITYPGLLILFLASSLIGQFTGAAIQGLTSVLGKEHLMSGRLSSIWQTAAALPGPILAIVAGNLAKDWRPDRVFLLAGFVAVAVALIATWRPKYVYDDPAERAPIDRAKFVDDVIRLYKTPGIKLIVLLLFICNFTPGVGTPIQFYLTDTLHGTSKDYGQFNAIFGGCFLPTYMLYGFLCTRVRFRPLLWFSTAVSVPQILPLLLVHSAHSALLAAVPMGLMGGLVTAAFFDLLIRACPKGLQGTAMMLGASAWVLSAELGNVAGSYLFDLTHSFASCAWATAIAYAMLLPLLVFLPRNLTAKRDGES